MHEFYYMSILGVLSEKEKFASFTVCGAFCVFLFVRYG